MQNFSSSSGSDYFFRGWQLAMLPSIRRFVLVPLLVNSVLFGLSFWWLFHQAGRWIPQLLSHVPHYFQWLSYLLWPIAILTILIVFGYLFSTIANMIASPFNGLLAEQLEKVLRQQTITDNSTLVSLLTDIPRILHREWQKFVYYLPKALLLLMLYFIPGLGQTVAPILWFIFGSWVLAIQYCDYPFDNHKIPFKQMRQQLWQDKADNLQFGALVSVATLIPLINLVIMPVAVCGATAMWVEKYANNQLN